MQFAKIESDDFMRFQPGVKPVYAQIEQVLIDIGGPGLEGSEYKTKVLQLAGWKYGKLVSFGAHPEVAATVFNLVRLVLETTQEKASVLQKLQTPAV
jgi:hypothetical protein